MQKRSEKAVVSLEPLIYVALEKLASQQGISVSSLSRKIIIKHLQDVGCLTPTILEQLLL